MLNTPEKVEANRRVAWARYYAIVEENKRLREEVAWLRYHRRSFYRLFQLILNLSCLPTTFVKRCTRLSC
jgi:hypothetical protein